MARMMIYEPNPALATKLCDSLKKEKYDAQLCSESTIPDLQQDKPSLILMDGQVKWTFCRPLLAAFSEMNIPILFLTNDRQLSSHLRALYSGRSDVLVVPYTHKAFKNKVHALLGEKPAPRSLTVYEAQRIAMLDGRRVELTAQEFALLLALMEEPDVPVSRERLLRKAWGYQSMGETRTVDVHIQRLRKKLGEECIETVYKCGYRLQGLIPCWA